MSVNGGENVVNKDLLPHLKAGSENGVPFLPHQAEGVFWIVKGVLGISYITFENSIEVAIRVGSTEIEKKIISINNPVCEISGVFGFVKAKFSISIDVQRSCLNYDGVACFKEIMGINNQWKCLSGIKGTLIHW